MGLKMIEFRYNGLKRPFKSKEYCFKGSWMTVKALSDIEGCEVSKEGLLVRLINKNNNPKFKTIEDCVFAPKMANGNAGKKNRDDYIIAKRKKLESLFNEQSELVSLWPAVK